MSVAVLAPGLLTTVQDRGRFGLAGLGIGAAGPMDEVAARLANALVGNRGDEAVLEISLRGPRLRFDVDACIALAGATFGLHTGSRQLAGWRPHALAAGDVLDVGRASAGARGYLAVTGGFDVVPVLGSRATDVNARLGPCDGAPLRTGDVLAIGRSAAARAQVRDAGWSLDPRPWFDPDPATAIRVIRGRHFDALDPTSRAALFAAPFRIASESNRVGYRLDGTPLASRMPVEAVSEAVAFGTVQLPPGGRPIVLMAEHPTTGGYPRIGQVAAIDLPRLAQRRPGDPLRFREIDLAEAQTRYLRRERELAALIEAIAARLEP
jgi:antagonist of KipI